MARLAERRERPRSRSFEDQDSAAVRVRNRQPKCVERELRTGNAVALVAGDRVTEPGEVYPDLVAAAGLEPQL